MTGASFTNDVVPEELLALSRGGVRSGHHIEAESLEWIVANPTSATDFSPAQWNVALLDGWDHLAFQPRQSASLGGSTMAEDEASLKTLIDTDPGTPTSWIFCGWPNLADLAAWDDAVTDADATATIRRREYFEHLQGRMVADSYPIGLMKVGHVIVNLAARLDANEAPGYDSGDLFRDTQHMSDLGRYVVASAVIAHLTSTIPAGPYATGSPYGDPSEYAGALQAAITAAINEELGL